MNIMQGARADLLMLTMGIGLAGDVHLQINRLHEREDQELSGHDKSFVIGDIIRVPR